MPMLKRVLLSWLLALAVAASAPQAQAQSPLLMGIGITPVSSGGGGGGGASFSFFDRPNAVTSTLFTSDPVTMGTGSISISGSGCQYAVNGGAYTSSGGTVTAGDSVTVQVTSSASLNTASNCVLTNGSFSDTYTVTTLVNTEADAFLQRAISAAGDPGQDVDGYYDTLFTNLKNGATCSCNLLSDLDVLYIFATPSQAVSLLNLVSTSYNATTNGSLTGAFTPGVGWIGNGNVSGSGSVNLVSYNPGTAGGHYSQNSAHVSLYSQTDSTNGSWYDIGQDLGSTEGMKFNARSSTNALRGKGPNDTTLKDWTGNSRSDGFFLVTRTGATAKAAWWNTTSLGTDNTTSSAVPNGALTILANRATSSQYSGRRLSAVSFGGGLTSAKAADLYSAIQSFMVSQSVAK